MKTLWMLTVIFGAVLAAALALPSLPAYSDETATARALFHPEWLIGATLLALPLYRAARLSWSMAVALVPIAGVHVLYIADSAVDASREAGLADGVSSGWYAVAFAQVAVFAIVGSVGAYRNLADRRFVRRMRSMTAGVNTSWSGSPSHPTYQPDAPITRRRPPRTGRASS